MGEDLARWRAVGAEFGRRNWLADGVDAAAFAAARAYAARHSAEPYGLLCPGVVTVPPAQAQAAEAALAVQAAPPAAASPPPALAVLPDAEGDVLDTIGRRRLGPLAAGYAHWAWQRVAAGSGLDAPRIFGVMRDGGFLAACLRAARPEAAAQVGEVWLSRRLCLAAAIASADDRESLVNMLVRARGVPARVAEALSDLGLAGETPRGLDPDAVLAGDTLARFLDWLAGPARSALAPHVAGLRAAILAHLGERGALDGATLPLLDVGYAGSIQRALSRILAMAGSPVRPLGLYVLTSPGLLWALREGGAAHGFLAHLGAPEWCANTFLRCREVFESLCSADVGPLRSYGPGGQPLCDPPVAPLGQRSAIAAIQGAALAHVRDTPAPAAAEAARRAWISFIVAPTPTEAGVMGDWLFDDALAVGLPRRLGRGPHHLTAPRSQVLWPFAAAIRNGCDRQTLAETWRSESG